MVAVTKSQVGLSHEVAQEQRVTRWTTSGVMGFTDGQNGYTDQPITSRMISLVPPPMR